MAVTKAFVRALAQRALEDAHITVPPVDLDDLALARALRIERHAVLKAPIRAAFRAELGLIQVIELPPTVERFPVAHEIGHAILDDGGAACTEAMIRDQPDAASLAEILESYDPEATASALAGQLLVPSPWLRRAVTSGRTVPELRELFDVTQPVIMIAILRDGLLEKVRTER